MGALAGIGCGGGPGCAAAIDAGHFGAARILAVFGAFDLLVLPVNLKANDRRLDGSTRAEVVPGGGGRFPDIVEFLDGVVAAMEQVDGREAARCAGGAG